MDASSEHPRLRTPQREKLLARFQAVEATSRWMILIEIMLTVVGVWLWWGKQERLDWRLSAWVGGIGGLAMLYPFFFSWMANKKPIAELKADRKFGVHDRDSLLRLVDRVCERLQVPREQTQVYLTREKEANAFALRAELLPGVRFFNSVYLNRGIVHLLDEPELEAVVAHELGHVWFYSPLLTRCYLIHALAAAGLSLGVIALLSERWGVHAWVPFVVAWALGYVLGYPWTVMGRGIEYLCDDTGAQGAGWLPSITGELKLGIESELRNKLQHKVMEAKRTGMDSSVEELLEIYEEALPFGKSDPTTTETELKRLLEKQKRSEQGLSFAGLYRYIQGSSDTQDDAIREMLADMKKLEQVPLLPWNREEFVSEQEWGEAQAKALIELIETYPDQTLFHLKHEVDDQGSTHPGHAKRLLFLWRNRELYRA